MKGVSYVIDGKKRVKSVIIDLKTICKRKEAVRDFLAALLAESRKGEPVYSWEEVKKSLRNKGKL